MNAKNVVTRRFNIIPVEIAIVLPGQGINKEIWVDQRRKDILDAPYYHESLYDAETASYAYLP